MDNGMVVGTGGIKIDGANDTATVGNGACVGVATGFDQLSLAGVKRCGNSA